MRISGDLWKYSISILAIYSLCAASGCKKDDDEEETPTVVLGPSSGGSIATPGSIMLAIDTTCGGEPCIKTDAALRLDENSDESFVQTIRGFYWLTTGFPDASSFTSFVPEGAQDLITQGGLTGRIENVRAHVIDTLIANSAGLTKCLDVPTSGSFEVEDDGTYTLTEAKNSAPASYPKTGIYDRRIEYVGSDFDAVFEWYCDYAGMMVKFSPKDDAGESLGFNYAFYYDREDDTDGHFEFFLNDEGKGALQSEPMSLALKVNVMSETFRTWMTQYAMHSGLIAGYRAVGHTNIESQKTSLWYQDLHNTPMSTSAWGNSTDAKATSITTAVAPNSGNSEDARQGCADNFSVQAHTITNSTLCSGLTLEVPAAPAIDADGDWSMFWIHANLATKLSSL